MLSFYIDPGTGSLLFSLLVGGVTAAVFGFRALLLKLKFFSFKDKKEQVTTGVIKYLFFSDDKRYKTLFEPILKEMDKRGIDCVYYTLSSDDPLLTISLPHVKTEFIGEGNKAFAKLNMVKADAVISTTPHLDVFQWKRSKNVKRYIHIPHSIDDLAAYRMFALDHFDCLLLTGEDQVKMAERIENERPNIKKKDKIIVGSPQFDELTKKYEQKKRVVENDKKVVLLSPSWGENGLLRRYGERLLEPLSKLDYHVIVRPHPQSVKSESEMLKNLQQKYPNFEWNFDTDNFDCLNKSDIMISDFSGVMFEYSLVFKKPIIYTESKIDVSVYDAYLFKDEDIWAIRNIKKLGSPLKDEDFDNLNSVINNAITNTSIDKVRDEIISKCYQNQGHGAEAIVDYLLSAECVVRSS